MSQNLKQRTAKGLTWSFIDKFGQQLIYLISGIVLARILSPNDYGLVGVLAVFTAIANTLVDSGFNRGLLNKEKIIKEDYNTVFYFNLFISVFLYFILYWSAPFIANYFQEPRLTYLSRILFLSIPFNALSSIQYIIVWKKMDFKTQTQASVSALILSSIIAIILAIKGFGAWALVAQNLLLAFFKSCFLWILNKWRPSLSVRFNTLKELFPFGSKLLVAGLVNVFFNNIYSLVIGKLFNMNQVGFYDRANKYQDMPNSLIGNTFRSVAVPAFSEIKNDNIRLKRVLSKMIKNAAFFAIPIIALCFLVAKPLFIILITEKWLPSVPLFQILCFAGLGNIFILILNELVVAKGRSDIFLGIEILKRIILVALIVVFAHQGVKGLALSWVIYTCISLTIALYFSNKLIKYNLINFIRDILPTLSLSLTGGILGWFVCKEIENYYLYMFSIGALVSVYYLILCKLFKVNAYNEIELMVKDKIYKRKNK